MVAVAAVGTVAMGVAAVCIAAHAGATVVKSALEQRQSKPEAAPKKEQ